MSLHQNAFPAAPSREVDGIAIRALAILASSRHPTTNPASQPSPIISSRLSARLYEAVTSPDREDATHVIDRILRTGVGISDIISNVVPAVANHLGQAWVDDTASFGAVTIGCARLQTIVHQLDQRGHDPLIIPKAETHTCLIVVPEGAQHTLGAVVLASELRHAGQRVQLSLNTSADMLGQMTKSKRYDAIMMSAALGQDVSQLRSMVKAAQGRLRPPQVMIGGGLLSQQSDLKSATNADVITNDWQNALKLIKKGCPAG